MRIGIDGRWFFSANPSGRVVVRNLLQQLAAHHAEHEYYVFLPRRDRARPFPFAAPCLQLVYTPGGNGLLSNCLFFPWRARKLNLDICLFFNFSPPFGRYRKVVFINDVIFLEFPEYFSWREKLYFWPMRFLSRNADMICTLSHSEKQRMIRCQFARDGKIAVLPLGVTEEFLPLAQQDSQQVRVVREKYHLPERFLLYVGRLNARKNILNLLKAMQALKNRSVKLVLAGETDWKMFDLPAKISELELRDRVLLCGHVVQADLPVLYALAAVFCYVSFAEGFGLPPLEAMASGVAVVVSDRDSLPEICAEAGTYIDPDDVQAMAGAIDRLLDDPQLRQHKVALGLAQSRRFSWERPAEKFLAICADLPGCE